MGTMHITEDQHVKMPEIRDMLHIYTATQQIKSKHHATVR